MINFNNINKTVFLSDYWQKKPLVLRQALPHFKNPLTPEELAGLSMEEEIESRIVIENPNKTPSWQLKRGPFVVNDFKKLPKKSWTLLVQGVDRFLPEVNQMFDYFDFLPQWRIDDVMISYAVEAGGVGPHYDNYDVFLYQALGSRKWSLTSKNCHPDNYLSGVELRIMKDFQTEEEYILEEGDMLYLPPHIGHYGVSTSNDCMTYSFGYRSYQAQELLADYAEYLIQFQKTPLLYKDPNWNQLKACSQLPQEAWLQARDLMQTMLANDEQMKAWFGSFVTKLDHQAEALLPMEVEDKVSEDSFMKALEKGQGLSRCLTCRFAYEETDSCTRLFINGEEWETNAVSNDLIKLVANSRQLNIEKLRIFLDSQDNRAFLLNLWKLQWLEIISG